MSVFVPFSTLFLYHTQKNVYKSNAKIHKVFKFTDKSYKKIKRLFFLFRNVGAHGIVQMKFGLCDKDVLSLRQKNKKKKMDAILSNQSVADKFKILKNIFKKIVKEIREEIPIKTRRMESIGNLSEIILPTEIASPPELLHGNDVRYDKKRAI